MSVAAIKIAYSARKQVITRFADPATGLNSYIDANKQAYGLNTPLKHFNFGHKSKNVWEADVTDKDLALTSTDEYPLLMVYSLREQNRGDMPGYVFSGIVHIGIRMYISWRNSSAERDMETIPDIYSAAVVGALNCAEANWTDEVGWSGLIDAPRGPLTLAGQNWIRPIQMVARFNVSSNFLFD